MQRNLSQLYFQSSCTVRLDRSLEEERKCNKEKNAKHLCQVSLVQNIWPTSWLSFLTLEVWKHHYHSIIIRNHCIIYIRSSKSFKLLAGSYWVTLRY
jgi:hypothetical protein